MTLPAGSTSLKHRSQHRHEWLWNTQFQPDGTPAHYQVCMGCSAYKDEVKSTRGRNNRARGNAYERDIARRLGAKRVGQYGTATDVEAEWVAIQSKVGGAFPERLYSWLSAIPAKDGQLRALVVGDAPGPGKKRREVIVMDLADFIEWFGK